MTRIAFSIMFTVLLCSTIPAQERGERKRTRGQRGVERRGEVGRSAQEALGAKLREFVEAGTLTRDEAVELYRAAFPERGRGGEQGAPMRREQMRHGRMDNFAGRNYPLAQNWSIKDPADFNKGRSEPIFSGPQTGEKLPSFKVVGMRGELEGKEFDPVEKAKGGFHIVIFADESTDYSRGLVITKGRLETIEAASGKKWRMTVVYLGDNPAPVRKMLSQIGGGIPHDVLIGFSREGRSGPGALGLDRRMAATVIIAKGNKVVASIPIPQTVSVDDPYVFGAYAKALDVDHETLRNWLTSGTPQRGRRTRGGR